MATIIGTEGADTLIGTAGVDLILGLGGNDSITDAPEGDATIDGGGGDDTIVGLAGGYGSVDEDRITGGPGRDSFSISDIALDFASDMLLGRGSWSDLITDFDPGIGGDVLVWSDAMRTAYLQGSVRLSESEAGTSLEILTGGFPDFSKFEFFDYRWVPLVTLADVRLDDLVNGNFSRPVDLSPQDDLLRGTTGADLLNGGAGDDILVGAAGADTLWGGVGRDTLKGGAGDDRMTGGYGDDLLIGADGADRIFGGFDADLIFGGAGADRLYGDAGRDTIYGGTGDDRIDGGLSPGRLFGEAGDDTLIGGGFSDTMTGGSGADVFDVGVTLAYTPQTDLITDFTVGEDRIDLRKAGVEDWAAVSAALGADASGSAVIDIAADGELSLRVTLAGVRPAELSASDFVF